MNYTVIIIKKMRIKAVKIVITYNRVHGNPLFHYKSIYSN